MGALLRYQLGRAMTALLSIQPVGGFPWPTFAANGIGGLGMGLLVGCLARGLGGDFEEPARLMLGVALLYIAASVVLSIAALVCGLTITRVF